VPAGGLGGASVVIQQPGDRAIPFAGRVAVGAHDGVFADQVVHPVPAERGLVEQVPVVQRLQALSGLPSADAVERRGGVLVEVLARVEAQATKKAALCG
jgi:hypothetical protein